MRLWYEQNDKLAGEAIFIASPALYERYRLWLEGKEVSERQQLAMTLYQYLIRMSLRSTPFGLFSGCAFYYFDKNPSTFIGERKGISRFVRLDGESLEGLRDQLLSREDIRTRLRIVPNPTLYLAGDRFRYIEQHREGGDQQSFVTATDDTSYLRLILNRVKREATFYDLVELLVASGAEETESVSYLSELFDSQILSFDLGIALTGTDQLGSVIDRLAGAKGDEHVISRLRELRGLLRSADEGIEKYHRIGSALKALGVSHSDRNPVQVDTFFETRKDSVVQPLMSSLQQQLSRLIVLNRVSDNQAMQRFIQRFSARFEEMEVPFNLALDPETGIGYGTADTADSGGYTPLLDDLVVPEEARDEVTCRQWWVDFLVEKYAHAARSHAHEIVLSDEDLLAIAAQKAGDPAISAETVPYGSFIFGNLLAGSASAAQKGDYLFHLSAFSGPSALPLLGRFACGSKDLEEALRQYARDEEAFHKDVILAEIICNPGGKVSNIAAHPAFYRYEIPYLGQASVGKDFQIPPDDLMISVRRGRVVLRSRRLNRRVVPRLSNAHNYRNGLPVYRFLCDLQYQDSHLDVRWDWSALKNSSSLPRVRYRNILLSRATWMLREEELKGVGKTEVPAALAAKGIPDRFLVVSGDNELLVDRNVPCSVELLLLQLHKHKVLKLAEFLMEPDHCWLRENGASYAQELVIPLRNEKAAPLAPFSRKEAGQVPRGFPIGSEWLYLKIYCGVKSAHDILVRHLYPAVCQMVKEGTISKFFFVNFSDPEFHLRLRFQGDPSSGYPHDVISAVKELLQPLLEKGMVSRIQTDTYQRELERYGFDRIECCETFFYFDSLSTLGFFDNFETLPGEQESILYAAARVHHLLNAARMPVNECVRFTEHLKEQFFREFRGDTSLRKQLAGKYREFRSLISEKLEDSGRFAFDSSLEDCALKLAERCPDNDDLVNLLASLVHMTVNRIFPVRPRMYELVLYHFLAKHYAGLAARKPEPAAQEACI